MTSRISHTTIDCHDLQTIVPFWEQVLAYTEDPDNPNEPGDEDWLLQSAGGDQRLLFIAVPDEELPGKRIHFDLVPTDGTRDEEVDRVLGLGATQVVDRRNPDGTGWVVLADPEGNQFCILRSAAERAATG